MLAVSCTSGDPIEEQSTSSDGDFATVNIGYVSYDGREFAAYCLSGANIERGDFVVSRDGDAVFEDEPIAVAVFVDETHAKRAKEILVADAELHGYKFHPIDAVSP